MEPFRNILGDVNAVSKSPVPNDFEHVFAVEDLPHTSCKVDKEVQQTVRLERNRESARLSRKRKRQKLEGLTGELLNLITACRHEVREILTMHESVSSYTRVPALDRPQTVNEIDHSVQIVGTLLKQILSPPEVRFLLWLTSREETITQTVRSKCPHVDCESGQECIQCGTGVWAKLTALLELQPEQVQRWAKESVPMTKANSGSERNQYAKLVTRVAQLRHCVGQKAAQQPCEVAFEGALSVEQLKMVDRWTQHHHLDARGMTTRASRQCCSLPGIIAKVPSREVLQAGCDLLDKEVTKVRYLNTCAHC